MVILRKYCSVYGKEREFIYIYMDKQDYEGVIKYS